MHINLKRFTSYHLLSGMSLLTNRERIVDCTAFTFATQFQFVPSAVAEVEHLSEFESIH